VPDLEIRPYEDADEEDVLSLLAASLGKTVDDRYRTFFRWKHHENPFGRSFMWVGSVDGRIAGFRSFLRWRFVDPAGEPVEAVRAVDTATHPAFQGMGIFRRLTMHGLDEMRPAGIDFVFNTPNDQSRPGYLKMGWEVAGRVPVKVRPSSLSSLVRMSRSRTAAEPWSLPADVGVPMSGVDDVGDRQDGGRDALVTDRTSSFVRWRYGGCLDVASRAIPAGDAVVVVRFRQRGGAVECTVADVLGPDNARAAGSAVRAAMRRVGADYAIASTATPIGGMVPASHLGPIQTHRDLTGGGRRPLVLTMGDLELF
jgi:GNAT superfamily N-acetyltransferase